jgi:hypothetical protein
VCELSIKTIYHMFISCSVKTISMSLHLSLPTYSQAATTEHFPGSMYIHWEGYRHSHSIHSKNLHPVEKPSNPSPRVREYLGSKHSRRYRCSNKLGYKWYIYIYIWEHLDLEANVSQEADCKQAPDDCRYGGCLLGKATLHL